MDEIIQCVNEGKNVMMLGIAGTGKTTFIKEKIANIENKNVFLTSTTGVSALNLGGSTFHSFFGIGLGDKSENTLIRKIKRNPDILKRLTTQRLLVVVDEISMMPKEILEKLNCILKGIRKNEFLFGGVQFLFSGDFMQLETINAENILKSELIKDFKIVELKENFRQKEDPEFQDLLSNIRNNTLTTENIILLHNKKSGISEDALRIFCINSKVKKYNSSKFDKIEGKVYSFEAKFSGSDENCINDLKKQFTAKDSLELKLKKNVRVMLTRNIDLENNLVNGSLGTIKDITNDTIFVKFDNNNIVVPVELGEWTKTDNDEKILAKSVQFPLVVSYSLSIHKCQGLTLDNVVIDLAGAFCNHQVYVALSRAKSLNSFSLLNFSQNKIKVNKEIQDFYKTLN